jgi:hypothetical protein
MCRGPGSSWISKTQRLPFGRSTWARARARLTIERLVVVLDLNLAIRMTTPAGVRPLAGGSCHLQGVTRGRPITGLLQKTYASTSMKAAMWSMIDSRRKVREEVETEGTDCSDRFPAFSALFSSYKYPEGFKPISITKYNGKQAPQQWLRCYSTAIEVAGGSNITKVIYFPMALDPTPLTWLESLSNKSIDSRERLKKVFIDNFQGAIAHAGTRHDLAQCKQERNELLWSYTRRFFDVHATIANILKDDIIDCLYNGITDPGIYRDFGRNRLKTIAGLRDICTISPNRRRRCGSGSRDTKIAI